MIFMNKRKIFYETPEINIINEPFYNDKNIDWNEKLLLTYCYQKRNKHNIIYTNRKELEELLTTDKIDKVLDKLVEENYIMIYKTSNQIHIELITE
ncbi:hypothetical protein SAMN05421767_1782 [Granulicatella balaenopterae]|uniref:Uncharacterized protein n=2 Tax=Granulicatella balaenopterae TaxID=137733 RepID=A0A1H9PYE6_9LACT|nr:hypothetical protein SAMN05421767_1782 [Granulicatella balaenopterae]